MADNRYTRLIEHIFTANFVKGSEQVPFTREEIEKASKSLGISLPKNLGDVIYSFRYRIPLPASIRNKAPKGKEWVIKPAGKAKYCFVAVISSSIVPSPKMAETKVPDSTPGVVTLYALSDEQALLARLRYNRLIDIFTGVTCYSLQSHLRTSVPKLGQIETDELYIGVDRRGVHYVFPVQAKGKGDRLSIVQIEQDFEMCSVKFPNLVCKPVAAQFMENHLIVLIDFEETENGLVKSSERHYRLVPPDELSPSDLETYRARLN